jgi:hypothetical protein
MTAFSSRDGSEFRPANSRRRRSLYQPRLINTSVRREAPSGTTFSAPAL